MTETEKLTSSDGAAADEFGDAVAISGNTIAASVTRGLAGEHRGGVYVFAPAP